MQQLHKVRESRQSRTASSAEPVSTPVPTLLAVALALALALSLGGQRLHSKSLGPTARGGHGSSRIASHGASRIAGQSTDQTAHQMADLPAHQIAGQIGGPTYAVAAVRDHLLIGVGPRLHVYAACDPYAPVFVSQTEVLPGIVQDVLVSGSLAYVALEDAGLGVLEIGDLADPQLNAIVPLPGSTGLLRIGDGRLYVGTGTGGVRIMDLGDPWAPREIGLYDKIVSDLAVVGQHIYAVQRNLTVVDVSDPSAPREWTKLEDWADAVATDGRYLYVGASTQGSHGERHGALHVYDLGAHPRRPPMIGEMPLGGPARNMAYVVTSSGPEIWLLEPGMFRVIAVHDPASPALIQSMPAMPTAQRLAHLSLDFVVFAAGVDGLRVHEKHWIWGEVAAIEGLGSAGSVASFDGVAFSESENSSPRLYIIDATEPERPRYLGTIPTDVAHKAIEAESGYLYVGARNQALRTYDVRDPMRPKLTSETMLPELAWSLDVVDGYLYVANDNRVRVFDLSSRAQPRELGASPTTGGANDLAAGDGFVFVTGPTTRSQTGAPSLQVFDARVPSRPREIGSTGAIGWRDGVSHMDPYVFVGGVQVIDVTDLAGPREVARLDIDADSRDSELIGNDLFVAQKGRGGGGQVARIGVAQPDSPQLLQNIDTIDGAVGLDQSWGNLHVAAGEAGLLLIPSVDARPAPTPTPWPGPPQDEHAYLPITVIGPLGDPCP